MDRSALPPTVSAHRPEGTLVITSLSSMIASGVQRCVDTMGLVTRSELNDRIATLYYHLEEKIRMTMAAREDELNLRLATRLGVLMAEVISLRSSVVTKDEALSAAANAFAAEVESRNAEIARQLAEALELDAQRDAARIEELLRLAGEDIPAEIPEVEIPLPGEPAEIPPDSGVPPVDESTLPDTETGSGTNQPV